jgi:hypothetical protein
MEQLEPLITHYPTDKEKEEVYKGERLFSQVPFCRDINSHYGKEKRNSFLARFTVLK